MELKFEWDPAKAKANWKKHGVSFDLATTVFRDPFAIDRVDDRADYSENRFVIVGAAVENGLLAIAYTEGDDCIRLISARRATENEQNDYLRENR